MSLEQDIITVIIINKNILNIFYLFNYLFIFISCALPSSMSV